MTTTINKTFEIDQPIEKVWKSLSDPNEIVTCVPGASLTEQIDENNFKGQVELKFGPVKAAYDGKITFLERNPETKVMHLKGLGMDSKGKGSAEMTMHGVLTDNAGNTEVNVQMDISITGMLAQFGSRLINDVSNQVFDQFVSNFKAKLQGDEVDSEVHAGSILGSVVKGFFGK
jgi:uncharacterized protein